MRADREERASERAGSSIHSAATATRMQRHGVRWLAASLPAPSALQLLCGRAVSLTLNGGRCCGAGAHHAHGGGEWSQEGWSETVVREEKLMRAPSNATL